MHSLGTVEYGEKDDEGKFGVWRKNHESDEEDVEKEKTK